MIFYVVFYVRFYNVLKNRVILNKKIMQLKINRNIVCMTYDIILYYVIKIIHLGIYDILFMNQKRKRIQ